MKNNIIETKKVNGLTVNVVYDCDPINPREDCDQLGVIYSNHRNVNPDRQTIMDCPAWNDETSSINGDELNRLGVWLPLAYYDHSVFRIFEGRPYTDSYRSWDSGHFGIIFASNETVKKWFGVDEVTDEVKDQALESLRAEIKELDAYFNGEVYAYEVVDERGEIIESCCGYYSTDEAMNMGCEAAGYCAKHNAEVMEAAICIGLA